MYLQKLYVNKIQSFRNKLQNTLNDVKLFNQFFTPYKEILTKKRLYPKSEQISYVKTNFVTFTGKRAIVLI